MSLKKKIDAQVAARPKYNISNQYYDNQAMARNAAFGRDTAIQQQENNLEQESADAIGMAGQYSNSASGILSTLSSISSSKNQALRNLAVDESAIHRQKQQDLYGVNTQLAEEQDKAFEYNVNTPYQQKIERLQESKRRRQGVTDTLIAGAMQGGVGLLGKIFSDERLKKDVEPSKYGLNEILDLKVMEYRYILDSENQIHVGLMAQNVLDKIPEAVDQKGKYLKVDYNEIVPVLIKAIQEQNKIIELLRQEVQSKQSA